MHHFSQLCLWIWRSRPLGTGNSGFFCVPGGIDGVILKKTEVKIEVSCKISVS